MGLVVFFFFLSFFALFCFVLFLIFLVLALSFEWEGLGQPVRANLQS